MTTLCRTIRVQLRLPRNTTLHTAALNIGENGGSFFSHCPSSLLSILSRPLLLLLLLRHHWHPSHHHHQGENPRDVDQLFIVILHAREWGWWLLCCVTAMSMIVAAASSILPRCQTVVTFSSPKLHSRARTDQIRTILIAQCF